MKSGIIKLYSGGDHLLGTYHYHQLSERTRAINIWKSRYMHKINSCYIQIVPDVDIIRIDDDGMNQKYGRKRKYQTVEKLFV